MLYIDLIISEKLREEQEEQSDNRQYLELPVPEYFEEHPENKKEVEPKRVIIIEL